MTWPNDIAFSPGAVRKARAALQPGVLILGDVQMVVAIGNAPTALFHLLDLLRENRSRPAAVVGIPVGFIGAAEAKQALADNDLGLEYVVVHCWRGGSAITCGALNATASDQSRRPPPQDPAHPSINAREGS